MSICFRSVDSNLTIYEYFVGFYKPPSTDATTLFKIICDVLIRSDLDIADCRGQCFDGAATMSGVINGVQAKFLSVAPTAYFVHCNAHNLSLAYQDGVSELVNCRDALSLVKDIVTSLRESPKRMACLLVSRSKVHLVYVLYVLCVGRCAYLAWLVFLLTIHHLLNF